jgi:outer membrane biosynthesis protein TonB
LSQAFLDSVLAQIQSHVRMHTGKKYQGQPHVEICFSLNQSGKLNKLVLNRSCRYAVLDVLAIATIKRADPFSVNAGFREQVDFMATFRFPGLTGPEPDSIAR